jgi:hypothetical protein
MTGTLRGLAKRLEDRAAKLDEQVSRLAVETADTIVSDLVNVTPVDTSQALSNWQVSLVSPVNGSIPPYVPGEGGSTQGISAAAALAEARAMLKTKKPGQVIYISNVLRYIQRLNDGSSKQAPAGFVERAVLLGRRYLTTAKLKP